MNGIYEDPLPPTDCQRAIYDDPLPPTVSPMEDFKINMKRISLGTEDDFSTSAIETEYDNVIKVPILTTSGDATQEADANLYDNIGKADCKQIPGAMQTSIDRSAHDNAVVLISDDIEFSISACDNVQSLSREGVQSLSENTQLTDPDQSFSAYDDVIGELPNATHEGSSYIVHDDEAPLETAEGTHLASEDSVQDNTLKEDAMV
ncbi:uncharacterized protein LOC135826366 isoform X2 [Sycon ciliatum]|uniref:uncharacterized protein LOC135826366 isoform X2 n=1 Tax=Sycon ciliatum TaxID=27933 RepID=UPI0031F63FE5